MTNVHACLVHEEPECVADLVANLRHFDPDSQVLLYDGSEGHGILRSGALIEQDGVLVHPDPSAMSWGRLHGFAFDCLQYALETTDFTSMTIVDSDQLLVRAGYSQALESHLGRHPEIGCLVSSDGGLQPMDSRSSLASVAWRERSLWRPFLRRFSYGEQHWPTWTFWPATVFTREAAADVVTLARDPQLSALLARTRFWATEELVLPTLVALHGRQVARTPFHDDLVRYRETWTEQQVRSAMRHPDLFWVHPVPRRLDDPLRAWVRGSAGQYRPVSTTASARPRQRPLLVPGDVLRTMLSVEGWFSREEGELLMGAAVQALTTLPAPRVMVEVGSSSGRSTVVLGSVARAVDPSAKIVAIDPHHDTVASTGTRPETPSPGFERFTATMRRVGLTDVVRPIRSWSFEVSWHDPIAMLVLAGLHDFAAVAVDYSHFERHLRPGALVAFHHHTPGCQGVVRLVDHLVECGSLTWVRRSGTLAVTRFVRPLGVASLEDVLTEMDAVEGWLSRDEAAYLGLLVAESVRDAPEASVVEVGSYCGRSTVVLARAPRVAGTGQVHTIDTFDGVVGSAPDSLHHGDPTWGRFQATIRRSGLEQRVRAHRGRSTDLQWTGPIALLVVDGLHDYSSVRADVDSLAPSVVAGGLLAFHDHADYAPDVARVLDELVLTGDWERVGQVGTLAAVRRTGQSSRSRPALLPGTAPQTASRTA